MSFETFRYCAAFKQLREYRRVYYDSIKNHGQAMSKLPRQFPEQEVLGKTNRVGFARNNTLNQGVLNVLRSLGRDELLEYDLPDGSGPEVIGAYCGNSLLQFPPGTTKSLPVDCVLATLSDPHFSHNSRIGDRTNFAAKFEDACNSMRLDKSAGLTSAYMQELKKTNSRISFENKEDGFKMWREHGDGALEEFTWRRVLALAVAPLEVLENPELVLQLGLLCPSTACVKDEPTPYRKTRNADHTLNPLARFRIIEVQSLEDEALCRVLVSTQVALEKRAIDVATELGRCPVLVGCGLEAGGRDILCRHTQHVAANGPQNCPDRILAGAVGDDSLASAPLREGAVNGTVVTWDGSAYDETADPHRYSLLALAFGMGYCRCGDSLGAAATLAFHFALCRQPAEVGGIVFARQAPWPSAVSHTSASDAVPAAAYSRLLVRNASFLRDPDFSEPTQALLAVGVRLKDGFSIDALVDGVNLLSCRWREEDGLRGLSRQFLNIGKALMGSARNWTADRAIAIDTLPFDPISGRDQEERRLWREFVKRLDDELHHSLLPQVVEADDARRKAALAVLEF